MSSSNNKHNKKLVFENNSIFLYICGVEDNHLKLIESSLPVTIYPKGNELTIEGDNKSVDNALEILNIFNNMHTDKLLLDAKKANSIINTVVNKKENTIKSNELLNLKIKIPHYAKQIEMKTISQGEYVKKMMNYDIVFSTGSAGTGKTFLSVAYGLSELASGKYEKIIITRPVVEAGESLGYLPGDFEEKISPYMRPIYDALYHLINAKIVAKYSEEGRIEVAPLAYMRGRTLSRAFIILDEAQNTTVSQMKMFLSRIGEKSKAIITGDITQSDLPKNIESGLKHALDILQSVEGLSFHKFSSADVVRHRLVGKILEAYRKYEN